MRLEAIPKARTETLVKTLKATRVLKATTRRNRLCWEIRQELRARGIDPDIAMEPARTRVRPDGTRTEVASFKSARARIVVS